MKSRARWAAATTLVAVALLLSSCTGRSANPAAPSAGRPAISGAPSVTVSAVITGSPSMFGASSAADFARCLSGAADAACVSGARPVMRVVTAGATAPGAPVNLVATSSGSSVTLTWSAPTSGDPVTTYIIEAGSAPGLSNLAVVTTTSTATTFSASGVGAGTYYVRVKAQNATGTSGASNEAILVVGPAACTSAPNAPTGLTSTVSGGTVTLTWSALSGGCPATSYVLQAGSTPGSSALANSNVGNVTSYVAIAVGAGTYYVRVVAANGNGQSAASNEVAVTVAGTTSGTGVTGTWLGLVANGDGMTTSHPQCGIQTRDLQLNLIQTGSSVTGSLTNRLVTGGSSGCDAVGNVATSPLTGSVGSGTISFTVPGDGSGFGNGTFTASRMSGTISFTFTNRTGTATGTFVVNKQ